MAVVMPVSGTGVRLPTRTLSAAGAGRLAFGFPSGARTANRKVTTMAAKVTGKIKLALPAGKANPAPPVGPALGSKGVNIMAFCKEYNAQTSKMIGDIIPVEITVYEDRSFTFILKTPPASILLKKAAGIERGAGKPNKDNVGQVTRKQVAEIAAKKLPDTNATKVDSVVRMIEGTAKNMGIKVVD
ncbi:hypothetical protein Vretimale_7798 [Volvox reticuliferus]|uniref:Large ribosomal subunit protein uL11c n=2 Tax=Volvox reticuliferus TaxID=1737510 RepID=A0A8J4GAC1_9CHLO|nr:hypothetical protein Vretimale_7798 [Volvox reticuliferus]